MRVLVPLGVLLLLAASSGCNSGAGKGICGCEANETCLSGRCFPTGAPRVDEPSAAKAICPGFTQVAGVVPNPAPAAGACPIPAPAQSDTPLLSALVSLPSAPGVPADAQAVGTTLRFDVPANTAAMTLVLEAVSVPVTTITGRATTGTFQFDNTAVPLRLTAPDGTVWYEDLSLPPADGSDLFVFFDSAPAPLVGSLNVPNTTRALALVDAGGGLPAGTWTVVVNDYANECATESAVASLCGPDVGDPNFASFRLGTYRTTAFLRPGPRTAQATLDVGLYVHRCPGADYDNQNRCCSAVDATGGCTTLRPELTAARAAAGQDPDAARFVSSLASLLANGGVCLGTVTWYDLPAWAQDKWSAGLDLEAPACDVGLQQLLTLSQRHDGGQMNLFLMPEILSTGSGTSKVVGIDGTIPGPASFAGTVQSGAAVSSANLRDGSARCTGAVAPFSCGADLTAYIAAHETGHYLGLYHTSEAAGDAFDPLGDTLPCQCRSCLTAPLVAACGTSSAEVSGVDCNKSTATCGGGGNLMFWLLDSPAAGKVSPQQSQVLLSSPLVH